MGERLYCVGLDVGTTTTQAVFSAITVENRAGSFAVPEMTITDRQILYESPVYFTPLKGENLVDGPAVAAIMDREYEKAGITPGQIHSGAVIITGETSRKENAAEVLHALSAHAGPFVVATAGPDLESILAAKGAGAVDYSAKTGETVLHMDIGGGTANLALIQKGQVVRTGCLNVGGRLIKMDETGVISYISPVLKPFCTLSAGQRPALWQTAEVAQLLCRALEMAAGKVRADELLKKLSTAEVRDTWQPPEEPVTVSFSGGVADCIAQELDARKFGDIGPELGKAIRQSSLCKGAYMLARQTIRATVIGAGCHSTQLSGSTVFCRNAVLPKKNLPVLLISQKEQEDPALDRCIEQKLAQTDAAEIALAMPGPAQPDQRVLTALAEKIVRGMGDRPLYVCLQTDAAKALGQKLSLLRPETPCICLDKLQLQEQSYLDIGAPVGPCFPVVIKTLILNTKGEYQTQ